MALAAAMWLLTMTSRCPADDEEDEKEIQKAAKQATPQVLKLADAVQKKDAEAAKKPLQALEALHKAILEKGKLDTGVVVAVMRVQSLRKEDGTGGVGFGKKPGVTHDGIESKLRDELARDELTDAQFAKQGDDLIRSAYIMAAIGDAIVDKCPVKKKEGNKDPKDWKEWSEHMSKEARDLAEAIKAKNKAKVKKAATKLYGTCLECHVVFKG
jgi:hypothetical protein